MNPFLEGIDTECLGFFNGLRSEVFWPIAAGLCPIKPHLKDRKKKQTPVTSVFVRKDLDRAWDFLKTTTFQERPA